MIPEESVLLLTDLDGVTTELNRHTLAYIVPCIRIQTGKCEGIVRTTYLGDEDLVTGIDTHGDALAVAVKETGANSEDLGLVLLLDGSLGEEDTGGSLGLGLDALDQDAVQEGSERLDVAEDRLESAWVSNCISQ